MAKKTNTGLFIGIGIAIVGVALLLILPKRSRAATATNPFKPSSNGGVGGSTTIGASSGNTADGCGRGASGILYTRTGFPLRRGSCGNEVMKLQAFLNSQGGYGLEVDGKFGQNTENAVKEEQSPFANFKSMYPNAVFGQISQEYYNDFIL